jgi:hypothetical protein
MLVDALASNKRVNHTSWHPYVVSSKEAWHRLLGRSYAQKNGRVVKLTIDEDPKGETDADRRYRENVAEVAKLANKHRNDTLTIVCLPRESESRGIAKHFLRNAQDIGFYEIKEQPLRADAAREYLRDLAKQAGIAPDEALLSKAEDGGEHYADELDRHHGTAKTTVARLFGRIMKEHGILAVGDVHEKSRHSLAARYLGHTAQKVIKAFDDADGSMLLIDEAYSLVDDRSGAFGDEAINTIVYEMEKRKDDMVVVFAGYREQMAEFLKKNDGIESRVAFHVHFDDYSPEELFEILKLMAKESNRLLWPGSRDLDKQNVK